MKEKLKRDAFMFRQKNGLNPNEPIYFKSLLLKLNVQSLFKPLKTQNISGIAVKARNDLKFMMINTSLSRGRQHFTIAHELYHLYIQPNFTNMSCNTSNFDRKDLIEYHADIFASNLILPEIGLYELIPDSELKKDTISLRTILSLEQYYSCSRTALLYKLKEMNIITSPLFEMYNKDKIKSAINYGYDINLYQPDNITTFIGDYGSISKQLFDDEKISETHYLSLLADIGIDVTNQGGENVDD